MTHIIPIVILAEEPPTFEPFSPAEIEIYRQRVARAGDMDCYRVQVTNQAVVTELLGRMLATIDAVVDENRQIA